MNPNAPASVEPRRMKSDPDTTAVFGHGFADIIDQYDWDATIRQVEEATDADVRRVLAKAERNVKPLTPDEFAMLISRAATPYIEQMARLSRKFTQERFGKTISLYIPMYVSNACTNKCVYCGFNHDNPFTRTTLTQAQIAEECKAIKKLGPFENLLIVAGEYPTLCGIDYLEETLHTVRPYFHNLTIEVQPMRSADYYRLTKSGLNGVVCFQETYHREAYKSYHPRGMKSHFDWRLNGFDRMGEAGVHKIGMGALLGLEDWRGDASCLPGICVIFSNAIGVRAIPSISPECVLRKAVSSPRASSATKNWPSSHSHSGFLTTMRTFPSRHARLRITATG